MFMQSQIWEVVMQVSLVKGQMRLFIGLLASGSLSISSHGIEAPIRLCPEAIPVITLISRKKGTIIF